MLELTSPQRYRNRGSISITTANETVISAWTRGEVVTGDAEFDAVMAVIGVGGINRFITQDQQGNSIFLLEHVRTIFSEENLHSFLLAKDSWLGDPRGPIAYPGPDGQWLWVGKPAGDSGEDTDTAQFDMTIAWGDCFVACDGYHAGRAIVPPQEHATVYDLGGDPLPEFIQLSSETRPLP